MGKLKPGVTYIYERADGVTYAREFGKTDRFAIGWDYKPIDGHANNKVWSDILKEAETNPTLQTAIDRVIMLYKLSKEKYE
jgi:hypothetical protein